MVNMMAFAHKRMAVTYIIHKSHADTIIKLDSTNRNKYPKLPKGKKSKINFPVNKAGKADTTKNNSDLDSEIKHSADSRFNHDPC